MKNFIVILSSLWFFLGAGLKRYYDVNEGIWFTISMIETIALPLIFLFVAGLYWKTALLVALIRFILLVPFAFLIRKHPRTKS